MRNCSSGKCSTDGACWVPYYWAVISVSHPSLGSGCFDFWFSQVNMWHVHCGVICKPLEWSLEGTEQRSLEGIEQRGKKSVPPFSAQGKNRAQLNGADGCHFQNRHSRWMVCGMVVVPKPDCDEEYWPFACWRACCFGAPQPRKQSFKKRRAVS